MASERAPIADTVELPAGESRRYEYDPDGELIVSLIEIQADTANTVEAFIGLDTDGSVSKYPRSANDGDTVPADDQPAWRDQPEVYPIAVSNQPGGTRYLTGIEVPTAGSLVIGLNNADGANPHVVNYTVSASTTVRAAYGGGA